MQSGLFQFQQHFTGIEPADSSEKFNFSCSVSFERYFRKTIPQSLKRVYIILKRHMIVMAADDMKFTDTRMNMLLYISDHLFAGQCVRALFSLILAEIAKCAVRFAYIRKIQAHILDEIDFMAVLPKIDLVC
ncbi:hypothetical protein D3C77_479930 [compost metagenome]